MIDWTVVNSLLSALAVLIGVIASILAAKSKASSDKAEVAAKFSAVETRTGIAKVDEKVQKIETHTNQMTTDLVNATKDAGKALAEVERLKGQKEGKASEKAEVAAKAMAQAEVMGPTREVPPEETGDVQKVDIVSVPGDTEKKKR